MCSWHEQLPHVIGIGAVGDDQRPTEGDSRQEGTREPLQRATDAWAPRTWTRLAGSQWCVLHSSKRTEMWRAGCFIVAMGNERANIVAASTLLLPGSRYLKPFRHDSVIKWKKMKWKCNDLKCVRKPTRSRLSLTHLTKGSFLMQSKIVRLSESPCNQSGDYSRVSQTDRWASTLTANAARCAAQNIKRLEIVSLYSSPSIHTNYKV